jgi:hypothetical protein
MCGSIPLFELYLNLAVLLLLYSAHDYFTTSGTSWLDTVDITLALVTFFTSSLQVLSTPSSRILALRFLQGGNEISLKFLRS